ncbi:MAG: hydrolase TatD, partial [Paludibacter sp.]
TYKKSNLPDIIKSTGLQHIVLETDAPYLAPVPHRGKRNESSYLTLIAARLAELYGLQPDEIVRITTQNANSLFNFK